MALTTEQKSGLLYKHYLGRGNTRVNREFFEESLKSSFVVKPDQLWTYSDQIPDGTTKTGGEDAVARIKSLLDGEYFTWHKSEAEPEYRIVRRWIDLELTKIDDGTDSSFIALDKNGEPIQNIIPFNYYDEVYNYSLKDTFDNPIYFGVGDWVFDVYSGILTFYGELPSTVNHDNPPKISFYQYCGGNGFRQDTYGFQGAVLPINNFKIAAGTTVFKADAETEETVLKKIIDKSNEIEPNFAETYGWDGADDNEGIALGLEKIVPLLYFTTKDNVKGYDDSANANIGTILSNKEVSITQKIDGLDIIYASQSLSGDYAFKVVGDKIVSKVGEETITINIPKEGEVAKVQLTDTGFVFVKKSGDIAEEEQEMQFFTMTGDISAALIYWDSSTASYQPFVTKDDNYYDFGFVATTVNGKIPPSVMLTSDSISSFNDTITPDYYGPRNFVATIALDTGHHIKSSDYVVYNDSGRYLNNILDTLKSDYTVDGELNLTGTIFLRAGQYKINRDLDLSDFINVRFACEAGTELYSENGSNIIINKGKSQEGTIHIDGFKLTGIPEVKVTTNKTLVFLNELIAPETKVSFTQNSESMVYLSDSSVGDIAVAGSGDEMTIAYISGTYAKDVKLNKKSVLLRGSYINSLTVEGEKEAYVKSSVINTLNSKYPGLYLDGCTVNNYNTASIDPKYLNEIPVGNSATRAGTSDETTELETTGRFPIFNKNDSKHLKYAEFAWPFNYNEELDMIELLYDREVLHITEDGKLTTNLAADKIVMNDGTKFNRHENSGLAPKTYDSSNTLNDVFRDLWYEKADLKDGKIPLEELPDSVAYGGLLYVGNWNFDDNNGLYPKYTDISLNLSKDKTQEGELQPGWFVIVSASSDESDEDDENDTPVREQVAEDGVVFTAGDWVIYEGAGKWQKIDRAYEDPAYTMLPAKANIPSKPNHEWYWKDDRAEGGALDFSNNTIIEAFEKVNLELRKLAPKKPVDIKKLSLEFAEDYPTVSYRTISASGAINPDVTTWFDATKTNGIALKTKCVEDDDKRNYKELIYFGDEANISIDKDDFDSTTSHHITMADTEDFITDTVFISKPTESMREHDHGDEYWKGFYSIITNMSKADGIHYSQISLSGVTINGKDDKQDASYAGSLKKSWGILTPYWNDNLNPQNQNYNTMAAAEIGSRHCCSGINSASFEQYGSINGISFGIPDVYFNSRIPTGKLIDIRIRINGDDNNLLCEQINIDDKLTFEPSTNEGYTNIILKNVEVPITHENNAIYDFDTNFNIIATLYDLYGVGHDVEILTFNGLRFDSTESPERCSAGNIKQDTSYKIDNSSFGAEYASNQSLNDNGELLKIGRVIDGEIVGEYRYPTEYHSYAATFKGQDYGLDKYADACFELGELDNASGFTLRINTMEPEKWTFDNMTGATENALIQMCLVDKLTGKKLTTWMDCNSPNDGFKIPDVTEFKEPVMYAGRSNALTKRVTFGRQVLSGSLYIRIALKKDSGLSFTGLEITEVI